MNRKDELDELLSKLKPTIGEKQTDALWFAYNMDNQDRDFIKSLASVMSAKYLDEKYESKSILLTPPSADNANGVYPLGAVFYGDEKRYPFGLREDEWLQHMGIYGRTGSGKTNAAIIVLFNLLRANKPFLIFDWKKNYRDVFLNHAKIFTPGSSVSPFLWNPIIPPPGTDPFIWMKKLADVAAHGFYFGDGCIYFLSIALDHLFKQRGVYEGSGDYPTFRDVMKYFDGYKIPYSRRRDWFDSTMRTLDELTKGTIGDQLNNNASLNIADFLNQNVILELDKLNESTKTFLVEALLLWIHEYRKNERDREIFKHAILIEEAHHILSRNKTRASAKEQITDIIFREIREYGEAVIILDQMPSEITKSALANTYTTIAMNMGHEDDIREISESLILKSGERHFVSELPVGAAIVKLQGRWFKPFLVKFPYFPLKKGKITDMDVKSEMAGYSDLFGFNKHTQAESGPVREVRTYEKKEGNKEADTVGDKERALLQDAKVNPFSGIVERYRRLGFNSYQGNKIKNILIAKNLIGEAEVNTRKGRIKVIRLTNAGLKVIGSKEAMSGDKRAGLEHEYWKNKIAEHFRGKGYTVKLEEQLETGGTVDITARHINSKIAIEIETGKSDAIYNIKKCIEAGFDQVISVSLTDETMQKVIKEAKNHNLYGHPKVNTIGLNELDI